jgi:glycosyltransferase involved in cell wall biosynthesis
MFSGRPIVVYSDPKTGIARYGKEEGWAAVVDRQDPQLLAEAFEELLGNEKERERLIANARQTAMQNHNLPTLQNSFHEALLSAVQMQA